MPLTIRKAMPDDLDRMCKITKQAKASLKARGVDQWQTGYPARDTWQDDIANGRVYVVTGDDGESLLGQFAFLEEDEPSYDEIEGAWKSELPYACIHRVAVADEARGRGIAGRIFAFAFERAYRDGFSSVRIDTHEDNLPMRRALDKAGFEMCGTIRLKDGSEDGAERIAYERLLKTE